MGPRPENQPVFNLVRHVSSLHIIGLLVAPLSPTVTFGVAVLYSLLFFTVPNTCFECHCALETDVQP